MRRLLVCLTAAFLLSIPAGSALADHHEAGEAANPCAGKNPCNPCEAKNPCNPCEATNPCNPCAGKNPCAEKNPCAPE
jgi:hypothetical protein